MNVHNIYYNDYINNAKDLYASFDEKLSWVSSVALSLKKDFADWRNQRLESWGHEGVLCNKLHLKY